MAVGLRCDSQEQSTINSQLPPLKKVAWRVAWMVTLKGSLYEYCLREDAKNAKFTSFLFSFERKENKSRKNISFLCELCVLSEAGGEKGL